MSGYYLLLNGEYAYNKSYSVGYDFGSIKRLDRYPMGALSTLYICFALKKHDSDFIKCSATSFLRNWDSILEKKRANLRSISEPARLRQPPPPEARERHTQEGGLKAYGRSDE